MLRRTLPLLSLLVFFSLSWNFAQETPGVPERPTDLRATTRFDGATAVAVLEWRDGSDNELGFEILRSDNSQDYRVVGMVGANTVRYEDKIGRYITGAFVYRVRAFNQAGKSEESNTVSVWF
jgi:hypothetical protein